MSAEPVSKSEGIDAAGDALDADLARYAEFTSGLQVPTGFDDRLFSKLDPAGDLWRVGRVALVAFASAAAVALAFDLDSRSALDETVLDQYDLIETEYEQ